MKNYILDIQAKLIKNWEKSSFLTWGKSESDVFFTTDGFVGYFVPNKYFLINEENLKTKAAPINDIYRVANLSSDYITAKVTGTTINKGKTLTVLEGGERKVYLDQKLFKEFDNCDFTFQIGTETQVVRVYYQGKLFAVICPIRK